MVMMKEKYIFLIDGYTLYIPEDDVRFNKIKQGWLFQSYPTNKAILLQSMNSLDRRICAEVAFSHWIVKGIMSDNVSLNFQNLIAGFEWARWGRIEESLRG